MKEKRYIIFSIDEDYIEILDSYNTSNEVSAFMAGISYGIEYQSECFNVKILDQHFETFVDEDTIEDLDKIITFLKAQNND